MKKFLLIPLLCLLAVCAQAQYPANTIPDGGDSEANTLKKTLRVLNDAKTGAAPLAVSSGAAKSATIATSKVTLSTSASLISAASTTRHAILIRNVDATISVYVGVSGVSSTTGFLLKAGESVSIYSTAAIYGIAASAAPAVNTLSEND